MSGEQDAPLLNLETLIGVFSIKTSNFGTLSYSWLPLLGFISCELLCITSSLSLWSLCLLPWWLGVASLRLLKLSLRNMASFGMLTGDFARKMLSSGLSLTYASIGVIMASLIFLLRIFYVCPFTSNKETCSISPYRSLLFKWDSITFSAVLSIASTS